MTTTFVVDTETYNTILAMRQIFGMVTPAAVIKKALAFASVAAEYQDPEGFVTFVNPDQTLVKINLRI